MTNETLSYELDDDNSDNHNKKRGYDDRSIFKNLLS